MAAAAAKRPTVQEAWANVMADVRALGKDQRNQSQGFNFRGVDDVMNALGPVLRDHGVMVIPTAVDLRNRDTKFSGGSAAHEATVVVSYTIYGPAGDSMPGAAAGESLDSGDKATPKAMSVAYRTFLLQALTLPTQTTDPDAETYERAAEPTPAELAQQCADEIAKAHDDLGRVRELGNMAHSRGVLDESVKPAGDDFTGTLREYVQLAIKSLEARQQADTADDTTTDAAAAA